MYIDGQYGLFEKTGKYPPLYQRAIYHFKIKFAKLKQENDKLFPYHDAETLANGMYW